MPEYTDEQIVELKKNAAKAAIDNLLTATGIESEDALLSGIKLVKEKNPLELEKKVSSLESELASSRLSKDVLSAANKTGFKDASYAEYLYSSHVNSLKDEEKKTATPEAFLSKMKTDGTMKQHFYGRTAANSGGKDDPPPDDDKGGGVIDLSNATPDQIKKRVRELGFSPRL